MDNPNDTGTDAAEETEAERAQRLGQECLERERIEQERTEKLEQERQEKITERCIFIEEEFEILAETFNFDLEDLYLNKRIVHQLASSYYDDLHRLKDYHKKMKLVNEHKISAYTAKWIIFLRPVQIPEKENRRKTELLANELLAWQCARSVLKINHLKQLEADTRFNTIYNFRFRHFTGRSLTSNFKLLQELAQEKEKSAKLEKEIEQLKNDS